MTFSAARVAQGAIARRKLRLGVAIPTVVGVTNGDVFGNITVTPPSGSVGDLIIVHLTRASSGEDPPFTQSSGETVAMLWNVTVLGLNAGGFAGGWRIRTGSDTTYVFDVTGGDFAGYVCYALSGTDATTPINDFSSVTGTGSSIVMSALTSDITNCMLLHLPGCGGAVTALLTAPGGSESVDHNERHGSNGHTHAAAREDFAAGGGTGTRTWTISESAKNHGGMILVAPLEEASNSLEFETSSNNLLFEDASGVLQLE